MNPWHQMLFLPMLFVISLPKTSGITVDECMAVLRSKSASASNQCAECERVLKAAIGANPQPSLISELFGVLRADEVNWFARSSAMQVLATCPDPAIAKRLFGTIEDISRPLMQCAASVPAEAVDPRAVSCDSMLIIDIALKKVLPELVKGFPECERQHVVDWLVEFAADTYAGNEAKSKAMALLANALDIPEYMRQRALVAYIANDPEVESVALVILEGLSSDSCEPLAKLANEKLNVGRVHWGAVAALAFLGETPGWSVIERARSIKDARQRQKLDYFEWQFVVQQSRQAMLSAIADGADQPIYVTNKQWLIHRALRRGIAKSQIREAILQYARAVGVGKKIILSAIKKEAKELDIFSGEEWPEIPVKDCPNGR